MIDLSTEYLGLPLKNPLIPSSSPMTASLDSILKLEDTEASAIVLPSIFEEELIQEQTMMERFLDHQCIGHPEADSFLPTPANYLSHFDKMLKLITQCKQRIDIPVIGSVNGISASGWLECASDMQEAGCDAIELNLYSVAADASISGEQIEHSFCEVVSQLSQQIQVPLSVKISSQFSSLSHFSQRLQNAGAKGIVCFNRFYQPDINLQTLDLTPTIELSTSMESRLRIRWIALLRSQLALSLAATGGFHNHLDILKALLAGADATYLCSVLLQQGASQMIYILKNLKEWMAENEYESIKQLKGSLSYHKTASPSVYERANYLDVMDSYTPSAGVKV